MGVQIDMSPSKSADAQHRSNKRTPTGTDHAVGMQIRSLRRAAGMTLKDLGDAVGVSCVQFQRYETGASRVAASRLFAISDALGVRVDSLIVDPAGEAVEPASRRRSSEHAELARAFKAISDPRHRLAIIALTRAIAAREEKPEPPQQSQLETSLDTKQ